MKKNLSPTGLKKKFDILLSRERSMARSIAQRVIKPKPFSVWEVLIPIIFILSYMKSKEEREIFIQNLLFTKKLALEAAFDMIKKGHGREEVLTRVQARTQSLLSSVPNGLYSEQIREEQIKEIDLLIDHYCKLLQTDGEDYGSLVINAYHTFDNYKTLLERLKTAEEKVTYAARRTLGSKADTQTLSRIEVATHEVRSAEAERIFNLQTQRSNA